MFPQGREHYSNSLISDSDDSLFIVDEDEYGYEEFDAEFTI